MSKKYILMFFSQVKVLTIFLKMLLSTTVEVWGLRL